MDIYKFGNCYTYTPDIEIEKKNGKFGIIYLPTNEVILPFEYDNIMINDAYVNNFFVVKNGLFGAVHFAGSRRSNDEMFEERENLTAYAGKPALVCDLPCEYDYFGVLACGESIFYNNNENVYLYVNSENTVIHFDEVLVDDYSVWGKRDDTLYLVGTGEIKYTEPFTRFRFGKIQNGPVCSYIDYENYDKLIWDDITQKYTLAEQNWHLINNRQDILSFNGKKIEFEYYSRKYKLSSAENSPIMNDNTELLGICEKSGNRNHITLPFAHTLQYVGMNRFTANCQNGKFCLCEIKYYGRVETECGFENLYGIPEFILCGYDYVNCLGSGYYEFIKEGRNVVLYNANDGSIKDTF